MSKRLHFACVISLMLTAILKEATAQVELSVQTGHSGIIHKIAYSATGDFLASCGSDGRVVVWDIPTGKQLIAFTGHQARVNDVLFHPAEDIVTSVSDDGQVILWSISTGSKIANYKLNGPQYTLTYSPDGKDLYVGGADVSVINLQSNSTEVLAKGQHSIRALTITQDGSLLAFGGPTEKRVKVVRVADRSILKEYQRHVHHLAFSPKGDYLVSSGVNGKVVRWRIDGALLSGLSLTSERSWQSFLCSAVNDEYIVSGNRNRLITVVDIKSGSKIRTLYGHDADVTAMSFSPDNKTLASAGADQKIILWDIQTGEIAKTLAGTIHGINALKFAEDGKSLVAGYENGVFRWWEATPGGEMMTNSLRLSRWARFLKRYHTVVRVKDVTDKEATLVVAKVKRKARLEGKVEVISLYDVLWNLKTNSVQSHFIRSASIEKDMRQFMFRKLDSPDSLLSAEALTASDSVAGISVRIHPDKTMTILGAGDSPEQNIPTGHTDKITSVQINRKRKLIATAGKDGLLKLWHLDTRELLSSALLGGQHDYMFVNDDSYYFASKGALENVGFRIGKAIYSFEQFDLKYNRPDKILAALHPHDTSLIRSYERAHLRRLQTSKLKAIETSDFDDIPELKMSLRNHRTITSKRDLSVDIECTARRSPLEKLHVVVNGVPLYPGGLPVAGMQLKKSVTIELSSNKNKIQMYVTNSKGTSSFWKTTNVISKQKAAKPDAYLVNIGASKYQQEQFNLRFAAKDAADIRSLFESTGRYRNIRTLSLINEEVTLENISKIESFLSQAKTDDVVLISYSGHGLLDKQLQYFLSTYETNFSEPASKSIRFDDFENLLTKVKSRKKVLLVDACHSGLIDKDEVYTSSAEVVKDGNITFRNVGSALSNTTNQKRSSLEFSKSLFADIVSPHGAVVISSAGGGEFAIEGHEWANGVFTYCFLKGIRDGDADLNRDGNITINELQRYLRREVSTITGGRQTPMSREENIINNFVIW